MRSDLNWSGISWNNINELGERNHVKFFWVPRYNVYGIIEISGGLANIEASMNFTGIPLTGLDR